MWQDEAISGALYHALRTKKNLQFLVKDAREDLGILWSSLANRVLQIFANFFCLREDLNFLFKLLCSCEHFSKYRTKRF